VANIEMLALPYAQSSGGSGIALLLVSVIGCLASRIQWLAWEARNPALRSEHLGKGSS
jgi:hypothetical protein